MAREAEWGICLARTDPTAPKHEGITYFIVDMRSPGLDIRPLREITGAAMFNEVFFDDVFVPDDCVIGEVNGGWEIARADPGQRAGVDVVGFDVRHRGRVAAPPGPAPRAAGLGRHSTVRLGRLLAEAQSLGLMTHRSTLRPLAGTDPGPRSQPAQAARRRARAAGAGAGPGHARPRRGDDWTATPSGGRTGFLVTRCLTIAGGTSEIQRNVIAERLLGLPRDPEPGS